jgi:hypothetical protein
LIWERSQSEANAGSALTLIVEAVNSIDGGALVVAAEDEEVLRVFNLIG